MKTKLAERIVLMILVPFLIVFSVLSVLIFSMISSFLTGWVQLEIRGITEVNAVEIASNADSVRISVISAAGILETMGYEVNPDRARADEIVRSMLSNDFIYNAWVVYEPDAFDGKDSEHKDDYPGAPSGRFIRSYSRDGDEIVMAPDMDEELIDDPYESPWYTRPRASGQLYIDLDNEGDNIWDYALDDDPVYSLSIVMPIFKDDQVIGCIGADLVFDNMTISISGDYESTVAIFYSSGHVFYAPDMKYAEDTIETLNFINIGQIRAAFENSEPLSLTNEYCIFSDQKVFAFFHPVRIRHYDQGSLFLFVATPQEVMTDRQFPVFIMLAATMVAVFFVLMFLLIYVVRKIAKPIHRLTLAADAISQGDIETEIGYYPDADGEISLLSQSLHRMVEQFRVHTMSMEQANKEMTLKSQIETLITASDSMRETFEGLGAMLSEYFQMFKTTIVFINAGKPTAFFSVDQKQAPALQKSESQLYNYSHYEKVESLLTDRKIVFLNAYAITSQDISFLEPQTKSAYFIPLRDKGLSGCLILENNGEKMLLSDGTESLMIYVAEILSKWLTKKEWAQDIPHEEQDLQRVEQDLQRVESDIRHVEQIISRAEQVMQSVEDVLPQESKAVLSVEHDILCAEQEILNVEHEILCVEQDILNALPGDKPVGVRKNVTGVISKLKEIEGINVESALEAVGGLQDVYEQTVKLTARLMPQTIAKMDAYLSKGEMKKFAVEVHGIKGVLRNIGASELGLRAANLESAANADDKNYCAAEYPKYKESLIKFVDKLNKAMDSTAKKSPMNVYALKSALKTAKSAAESYDAMQALDSLKPLSSFSHSEKIDGMLEKVIFALEEFNCQGALTYINNMEEMLNG